METLIPIASLLIVAFTFVSAQLWQRRSADGTYVRSLEERITACESRLVVCESARATLAEENLRLMRTILLGTAPPAEVAAIAERLVDLAAAKAVALLTAAEVSAKELLAKGQP